MLKLCIIKNKKRELWGWDGSTIYLRGTELDMMCRSSTDEASTIAHSIWEDETIIKVNWATMASATSSQALWTN